MNEYVKATGRGIRDGVKAEWDHVNTLGGVFEYAIAGKDARLAYAGVRTAGQAIGGAVREIRKVHADRAAAQQAPAEQAAPLTAVPDPEPRRKGA